MGLILRFVLPIILLFATAVQSFAGPSKTFRDWSVYCTNALSCTLSTQSNGESVTTFSLTREFGPNTPLKLSVYVPQDRGTPERLLLVVDGGATRFELPFNQASRSGEYDPWVFSGPAIQATLFPAMKAGSSLSARVYASDGNIEGSFSLSGVVAAALFVDEAQQRLEQTDALHAVGGKIPQQIEGPRQYSSAGQLPPKIRAAWEAATFECSDIAPDTFAALNPFSDVPDEHTRIYILPCGGPGAYNAYYAIFREEKTGAAQIVGLPQMGANGPGVTYGAYNLDWDRNKKTLSAFFKGRGIGDCGLLTTWQWSDGGDSGFVLKELRRKDDCDGQNIPLENWPKIWP